jgi:hypothetical protein
VQQLATGGGLPVLDPDDYCQPCIEDLLRQGFRRARRSRPWITRRTSRRSTTCSPSRSTRLGRALLALRLAALGAG